MAVSPSKEFPPKGGFKTQQDELAKILEKGDISEISNLMEQETQLPWDKDMLKDTIEKGLDLMYKDEGDTYIYNLIKYQQDLPFTEEHLQLLFNKFWDREYVYFHILRHLDKTNNPESVKRRATQRELFLLKREKDVQIDEEDLERIKIPDWMTDSTDEKESE